MEKIIEIKTRKELQTKSGKSYIGITDTDGGRYSIFDPKLFPLLQEGAEVHIIGEEKDGYFNVRDVKSVGEKPIEKLPDKPTERPTERSREGSIEKQVLAKLVSELWLGGKLTDDDPEVKGLRRWMKEMLPLNLVEEAKRLGAVEVVTKEMATKEQIAALKAKQEEGAKLGEIIKEKGWTAKKASELTNDQATELLNELNNAK